MKYGIDWEDGDKGGSIWARFNSYEEAEAYALECEEIPYGVKKARSGSFWIVDEEGEEVSPPDNEPSDGFLHDGEADGDALASAGMGTSEDYGGEDERL